MKVIKKSEKLNGLYSKVRFSCPVCDSRLEEWKKDLQPVNLLGELYFCFICPVCRRKVAIKESDLESMRGVDMEGLNERLDKQTGGD